ncbi:hypothetical protein M422DRAFT_251607 [Sphaerobolus stellatus SS14]|uniref:Uncharacterized protein n=1 Tax=Sphaerobolus stellatus (strain SS14) TaxID=990650 RepID=A0A0C9UQ15_SPHS4|nr:hypothetical protein M422DRAFT_251607 [Sphaerobolus stellatus SS14]
MFSLPDVLGQDANETFDGYPVVQLQDIKDNFEKFLDVLYRRSFLNQQLMTHSKIPVFFGILRISTKYLFEDIKQACIDLLRSAIPDDFQLWQSSAGTSYAASSLQIIRDHNIIHLLPQALYSLYSYSASDVLAKLKNRPEILAKFLKGKSKLSGSFM